MSQPDFSGVWKLNRGESEFGFLQVPRLRVDTIEHTDPEICIVTRQIDSNGEQTVERRMRIGGEPVEVAILNRARLVSARWDGDELLVETRSVVSGAERLLEDRWALDSETHQVTVTRVHHQPGGAVRQVLRFRAFV